MHRKKEEFDRINEGPKLESRRNGRDLVSEGKQDVSETGLIDEDTGFILRRKEFLQSMQLCSPQEK